MSRIVARHSGLPQYLWFSFTKSTMADPRSQGRCPTNRGNPSSAGIGRVVGQTLCADGAQVAFATAAGNSARKPGSSLAAPRSGLHVT